MRRVAIAIAAALLVAGLAIVSWRWNASSAPPQLVPVVLASPPAPTAASVPASAPPLPAAASTASSEALAACPADATPAASAIAPATKALWRRLAASPDAFDRAIALMGPDEKPVERTKSMAALALASNDPRVYALAYHGCFHAVGAPQCAGITSEGWAALDPSNAVPWFYVMAEAAAIEDIAARDDALQRMAAAERVDFGPRAIARTLMAHRDPAAGPADDAAALQAFFDVQGWTAAWAVPYGPLQVACTHAGGPTREACVAFARHMARAADMPTERLVASGMLRRWTGEASAVERAASEALSPAFRWPQEPTCGALASSMDDLARVAREPVAE